MRVRNNRLHCQNCYSNDEGKLLLSLFVSIRNTFTFHQNCYSNDEGKLLLSLFVPIRKTFTFTVHPIMVTFTFRVEVQQSVIATEEEKIYTRLKLYHELPGLHREQPELHCENQAVAGSSLKYSSTKTSSPPNTSHSILSGRYSYRLV